MFWNFLPIKPHWYPIIAPTIRLLPVKIRRHFFCKTIYSFPKNGTQRIQRTNHYILLTNNSIKICIKTSFETDLLGGGGEQFQPDKYLTDRNKWISMSFIFSATLSFQADNSATEYLINNFYYKIRRLNNGDLHAFGRGEGSCELMTPLPKSHK